MQENTLKHRPTRSPRGFARLLIVLFFFCSFTATSQTIVKMDTKGNYTAVAKTAKEGQSKAKQTNKTFTDAKGNVYPVFESKNGKFFYKKTSKKGNEYNVYLTTKTK